MAAHLSCLGLSHSALHHFRVRQSLFPLAIIFPTSPHSIISWDDIDAGRSEGRQSEHLFIFPFARQQKMAKPGLGVPRLDVKEGFDPVANQAHFKLENHSHVVVMIAPPLAARISAGG